MNADVQVVLQSKCSDPGAARAPSVLVCPVVVVAELTCYLEGKNIYALCGDEMVRNSRCCAASSNSVSELSS